LPTALARNFAYACLDRNPEAPLSFIGEDPLQNVEFRRWKIYHFASIGDHVRPQNDSVKVTVEVEEETEDTQVLTVRLKSDHIGERSHKQHWRRENGQWLFDAVSTLGGTTQNTK
jgi:hypothetical protein